MFYVVRNQTEEKFLLDSFETGKVMLYETKCWSVKNQHENKLSVIEIKMLC